MIRIVKDGIEIDEEGWYAANPRPGRGIEVFFDKQIRVVISEGFIRHAVDLLEWERNKRKSRAKR